MGHLSAQGACHNPPLAVKKKNLAAQNRDANRNRV